MNACLHCLLLLIAHAIGLAARILRGLACDAAKLRLRRELQFGAKCRPQPFDMRGLSRRTREVVAVYEAVGARDQPRIREVLARRLGEPALEFVAVVTRKHERVQQRALVVKHLGGVAGLVRQEPVAQRFQPVHEHLAGLLLPRRFALEHLGLRMYGSDFEFRAKLRAKFRARLHFAFRETDISHFAGAKYTLMFRLSDTTDTTSDTTAPFSELRFENNNTERLG